MESFIRIRKNEEERYDYQIAEMIFSDANRNSFVIDISEDYIRHKSKGVDLDGLIVAGLNGSIPLEIIDKDLFMELLLGQGDHGAATFNILADQLYSSLSSYNLEFYGDSIYVIKVSNLFG